MRRKSKIRAYRLHKRVVCLFVVEFICFTKIASIANAKNARSTTPIYIHKLFVSLNPPPPFFCKSLSNRFLSKIYICIYLCICIPRLFFRTFRPRRRSPTQRSSLTYGYSNDQGTLDGSDMESLSRRCPPSESAVSIFYRPSLNSSSTIARIFFLLTIASSSVPTGISIEFSFARALILPHFPLSFIPPR